MHTTDTILPDELIKENSYQAMFEPLPFKIAIMDGISVYIGRDIQTNIHSHHLLEIALAFDQPFTIADNARELHTSAVILASDVPHQFIGEANDYHIFILFDPESSQARLLQKVFSLHQNRMQSLPVAKLHVVIEELKKWFFSYDNSTTVVKASIERLMQLLAPFHQGHSTLDSRILHAIRYVADNLEQELDIITVSREVCLSESRFSHLFKQQIGIPYRRYILWRRIDHAVKVICNGASISEAAFESGFSDPAHLSRTFQEMFGLKPSFCFSTRVNRNGVA